MKRIVTHDGTFHADDVMAHAVLSTVFPDAMLTRTRDESQIEQADIVFDVGARFDSTKKRFDHHMTDAPKRPDGTPYSSVGLVWHYFGLTCLNALTPSRELDTLARVWDIVDKSLIREIDLADNGIGTQTGLGFAALIDDFNPTWDDRHAMSDERFLEASELACNVLVRRVESALADTRAYEKVRTAARSAQDPRIVVLPASMPWQGAIFEGGFTEALYMIYRNGDTWYCAAVPPSKGSFAQRKPLPAAWSGLRNDDLDAASGVEGTVFCHPARFVCGARSFDAIMQLARTAADH